MPSFFHTLFSRINLLSLDVAAGAIACGSMVVCLLGVHMPSAWWLALPLSVWVIYTADHLMDAYRLKDKAHTARHLFHHQHFRFISLVAAIALLFCLGWVPFHLPVRMVYFGLAMGAGVLIHLGLVSWIGDRISPFFHKELGVGLIYTAGVWGGPLSLAGDISAGIWFACAQFFLLVMFNLFLFSLYEIRSDEIDGHTSFVRAIGASAARKALLGLGSGIVGLGILALKGAGDTQILLAVQGVYAVMLAVLLAIAFLPHYFGRRARYRYWGDAIFILPILVWLMG